MTRVAPIVILLLLPAAWVSAEEAHPSSFRFEIQNDQAFSSDNFFTSGVSIQFFGPEADTFKGARGTPAFGKKLAQFFLPRKATDRTFREGWSFVSVLATPMNLREENLLPDDIPYSAMLGVTSSWVAFNEHRFTGFQYMVGLVGPGALGKSLQSAVHRFFPESDDPKGWDNQLDTEIIVNLTSMWKWKQWNTKYTEGSWNLDAVVGNWATLGDASLEMRFGSKRPLGYVQVPDIPGRSMTFDATTREGEGKSVLYYSVVVRATGIAHLLMTDGNTFKDSPNVKDERVPFVGYVIAGVHYRYGRWEVNVDLTCSTDFFSDSEVLGDERDRFGSISIGYRF